MTRSPDYDIEAADLVARTLRAVAVDTGVAEHGETSVPVAGLPAPIHLGAHRRRRVRRTVAATAAAAAVLVAALVWAGRNLSDPSGPTTTGDLSPADQGPDGAPTELVPGVERGLTPEREPLHSTGMLYVTQARILGPSLGERILAAVITWPDGQQPTTDELSRIGQELVGVFGDHGPVHTTAVDGQSAGYLTMPLDPVDDNLVADVNAALAEEGIGIEQYAADAGWPDLPADISWMPGVAPTIGRRYSDGGPAHLDLYTTAGDIGPAMAMVAMLPDARPYPVGAGMGWQAPLADGGTLLVWQAGPGTVGTIVASEAAAADVGAVVESIPTPAPAPGEHPNARPVGQSDEGSDVPWVVEAIDYLSPYGGPPGADDRACLGLWVAGQVPVTDCGGEVPPEGYSLTVAQVDDATVVFAEVAPTVAAVATDAPGAEQATVETQPADPANPDGLRYAVLIVRGGRDEPQTFRLLGAGGEELSRTERDLNEVGG
jgi:hypothetical protein